MTGRNAGAPAPVTRTAMSATPPFAALATAPGLARGHVRATLAGWNLGEELADIAELIASEMTANAVNASAPVQAVGTVLVIRLCLITNGDVLTIECWDQAPGVPVMRQATGFEETGRGLAVIDSLTGGAWGWQPAIGQAGKCVWAEIPVRDTDAWPPLALAAHPKIAVTCRPREDGHGICRIPASCQ